MRYLLAELLCILVIAYGFGWWVTPGAGLVVGGSLGLLVTVAAQIPPAPPAQSGNGES